MTMLIIQLATIAVFASGTVDPNTALPVAPPIVYSAYPCGLPQPPESSPPIVNPSEGFWPDTASTECRVNIGSQMARLPDGSYRAALKIDTGPFGPVSNLFSVTAAQPGTTITAALPFRVQWNFDGLRTTGYRFRLDGIQVGADLPLSALVAGTVTASHAGVAAGSHTAELSAFGPGGETRNTPVPFQATDAAPSSGSNGRVVQP